MDPAGVCFWEYSQCCAQGESGGRNSIYGRVFIVGGGLAAAKFVVTESVLLFKKGGWDGCLSLIPCEELGEK